MSLAIRFLHLVAAMVWTGDMLLLALVLVPVTRRLDDATLRTRLTQQVGRRSRTVGWIALGALVVSGLGNLWLHPFLPPSRRSAWSS